MSGHIRPLEATFLGWQETPREESFRSHALVSDVRPAITDTGIPGGIRGEVLTPFFTMNEVWRETAAVLSAGLAIAKGHEGRFHPYSEVVKGTTFRICIPATGTVSRVAAEGENAHFRIVRPACSITRGEL